MRSVVARLLQEPVPDAPPSCAPSSAASPSGSAPTPSRRFRRRVLRDRTRNQGTKARPRDARRGPRGPATARASATSSSTPSTSPIAVDSFMEAWWPQVDPRQALLWLADTERAYRIHQGVLSQGDARRWPTRCGRRSSSARGRWPTSPSSTSSPCASPGRGGRRRGARLLRDRRARRPCGRRELTTMGSAVRVRDVESHVTPTLARERLLTGRVGRPAPTPTSSSTRRRTSRRCSGAWSGVVVDARRGPSSATPPRPRGRRARGRGGARGRLRQQRAASLPQ